MGRQINFFMMPDDVVELDTKIKELGLVIIADCVERDKLQILSSISETENTIYLALPEELNFINLYYTNEKLLFRIHPMESQVIEYSPSKLMSTGKELIAGRIFYQTEYFNSENKYIAKNPKLTQINNNLFNWFKKRYKEFKIRDYYFGEKAFQLVQNNQIFIKHFSGNQKVA